jgi:NAD(P)-dependent dehydrogenase (short-subunit alcohol dehydrogenase family)
LRARPPSNYVSIVTGATGGIGYETARGLARVGATTIVVGRNLARAEAAAARIRDETNNQHAEPAVCDLSSREEVQRLVEQVRERYPKLDLLINNAGVFTMRRTLTVDGIELQWAVNALAYYLIAESLADLLVANAPARIIQVSSDAHYDGTIDFDDLSGARHYSGIRAYSQSKLANVLHTYDLAQRLAGSGVTANCLHPGVIRTGIAMNNGGIVALAMRVRGLFTPGPAAGARTSIFLATSPEIANTTGAYFENCRPKRSARLSYDTNLQEKLRASCAQLTGVRPFQLTQPGSTRTLT